MTDPILSESDFHEAAALRIIPPIVRTWAKRGLAVAQILAAYFVIAGTLWMVAIRK